jgi:hypothetical protein
MESKATWSPKRHGVQNDMESKASALDIPKKIQNLNFGQMESKTTWSPKLQLWTSHDFWSYKAKALYSINKAKALYMS